jgi:outer membrane protein assembly factor BamB
MTTRRKRLAAFFAAGLALACGGAAPSDAPRDWPQFNGANGDNISRETGLLKQWPKDGPPLLWIGNGLGQGYSSVSVANGRIFSAGDESKSAYVIALREEDGKQIWKSKLGRPGGDHPGTRATPTVDGDLLYMLGQWGDLVCYKAEDGQEVWRTNLNLEYSGHVMSGWGNAESPVVEGEKLICTPGGKKGTLMALDKKTGHEIWRSAELTDAAAYMAPAIAEIGGVRQAVVLTDRSVAGVGVADGKLLWRHDRPGSTAVVPTPIVKDNFVYVTSGYGVGCDAFKVSGSASDGFTAEPVYTKNKVMVNHHGGVVLVDGYVYGHSDSGGWTCQELASGKSKWTDKLVGKGTLTYADGRFYLRGERSGDIDLLEAGPDHHSVVGKLEQPNRSNDPAWAHLVVANGRLYVRDQGVLLCYDVRAK